MKILHVISKIAAGGAEIFVKDLSIQQRKTDKVTIISFNEGDQNSNRRKYINELKANDIDIICLGKRRKSDRLRTLFRLRRHIKQIKPDIINAHLGHVAMYTIFASIGLKIPVVQTIHSSNFVHPIIPVKPIVNRFAGYIAVSDSAKRSNRIHGISADKIRVIRNGIKRDNFSIKTNTTKEGRSLVAVGRLHPVKNQMLMLKAINKLKMRVCCLIWILQETVSALKN